MLTVVPVFVYLVNIRQAVCSLGVPAALEPGGHRVEVHRLGHHLHRTQH